MASLTDLIKRAAASATAKKAAAPVAPPARDQATRLVEQMRAEKEAAAQAAQQAQVGQFFKGLEGANFGELAGQVEQGRQAEARAAQERAGIAAQDQRYYNDLSFLDPTFQQNPALINRSAVAESAYADPNAIRAQQQSYEGLLKAANDPYQWQSPAAQQALQQQWAAVQGGQGAPQFMGGAQQEAMRQQLLGVKAPEFAGDATQRGLLNQITGQVNDPTAGLTFDNGARQQEQYGNLQGIIAGGGADTLEMAARQRQRADQESWLRGQREADMQDYAERGLTGSGQELLALSADRQAAAGRNSLADLDTAASLERRRLDAINSAGGLASTMRGNTIAEQGLLAQQKNTNFNAATSLANNMRGADFQEKAFLNESARQQALQAAGISESMRNQQFNENSYLDKRALDALMQQTNIADQLRTQQFNEQNAQRSNQMQGLQSAANIANSARSQSFNEANTRASATDAMVKTNADRINEANTGNVNHLRDAQRINYQNRFNEYLTKLQLGLTTAKSLAEYDQQENVNGFNQAGQLGTQAANAYTNQQNQLKNDILGVNNAANAQIGAAKVAGYQADGALIGQVGNTIDSWINMGMQAPGGMGGASGAPAAPPTNLSQPQIGASSGYGGSPNYGTSVTGTRTTAPNYGVSVLGGNRKLYDDEDD